jgi:hypothetical protein
MKLDKYKNIELTFIYFKILGVVLADYLTWNDCIDAGKRTTGMEKVKRSMLPPGGNKISISYYEQIIKCERNRNPKISP